MTGLVFIFVSAVIGCKSGRDQASLALADVSPVVINLPQDTVVNYSHGKLTFLVNDKEVGNIPISVEGNVVLVVNGALYLRVYLTDTVLFYRKAALKRIDLESAQTFRRLTMFEHQLNEKRKTDTQYPNRPMVFSSYEEMYRLLRNGVYALYGRKFMDQDVRQYFAQEPWYFESSEFDEGKLDEFDRADIQYVSSLETDVKRRADSVMALVNRVKKVRLAPSPTFRKTVSSESFKFGVVEPDMPVSKAYLAFGRPLRIILSETGREHGNRSINHYIFESLVLYGFPHQVLTAYVFSKDLQNRDGLHVGTPAANLRLLLSDPRIESLTSGYVSFTNDPPALYLDVIINNKVIEAIVVGVALG
jgi:hypothetical protein